MTRTMAMLLMATLVPSSAYAQAIAGSLGELQKLLKPGEMIVVTDAAGRNTTGKFVTVLGDSLLLSVPGERRFPKRVIAKVRRSDPLWNGAIIGGFVLGVWCAVVCGQGLDTGDSLLRVVAANAGIGALIGAGMDALDKPQLLYSKPPGLQGSRMRYGVTLRFQY
jgi:hypothetical protein